MAYHHGDLRRALLAAAIEAIGEHGPAAVSLRDLARRADVSHAAPAHHFGDKAGLLTAVAIEGFTLLARTLRETGERTGSFLEIGVAYVGFAVDHPAHFAVMYRPDLYHADDPAILDARAAARAALRGGLAMLGQRGNTGDPAVAALAAWSTMHGLATLWLSGSLPDPPGDDPRAVARAIGLVLFP
ncbi:MAG: TetR family transcriptional regulator [Actinobacteria bacterium 13_1_20CM_3_71_11]|nr:MAG: TetR family transcriptional regulator [Actinobacteria bacterium 13_1_20CM_3_71_11]